jgi:hypothetical protein
MRMRAWSSIVLVTAVLGTTAAPSNARTSLPSPAARPAGGCAAPPDVRAQNLQKADYLLDGSATSFATSWVASKTVADQVARAAAKRAAGELVAAEFAEATGAAWATAEALTGWGAVVLLVGYLGYKFLKDDPPDARFTAIATPQVHGAAVDVAGMTPAEAGAVQTLAANTRQLLAVAKALATTQNRATGATAAGQAGAAQRQNDVAKQYALRLAGLLDAQPALRAGLSRALAADNRFPPRLQPGPGEVRDFQREVAAHGVPAPLTRLAQQAGLTASDLAQFRASIGSAHPAAVAGISFPGVLSDPQINAFEARGAASWRQFAAGACSAPTTATPTATVGGPGVLQQEGAITVSVPTNWTWDLGGAKALSGRATIETPFGDATYTWTIPATIPRSGAQATITVEARPTKAGGSNLAASISDGGEVDIICQSANIGCSIIEAYTKGGNTDTKSLTFTIKPRFYSQGRTQPINIGLGLGPDGPTITIPYHYHE